MPRPKQRYTALQHTLETIIQLDRGWSHIVPIRVNASQTVPVEKRMMKLLATVLTDSDFIIYNLCVFCLTGS